MKVQIQQLLEIHNLRKTEMRKDVLGIFLRSQDQALSSSDIEERMGDLDRITLYRTLKTFQEKGLIHEAIDGSGTTKYAICKDGCSENHHHDHHAHFHCLNCGMTFCLDYVIHGQYKIPAGFLLEEVQMILKGCCRNCQSIDKTQTNPGI